MPCPWWPVFYDSIKLPGRAMKRLTFLVGALLALILAAMLVIGAGLPERAVYTGQFVVRIGFTAPEPGAIAPPFRTKALTGETIDLPALRGSPVILNFWATWCEPCVLEMPLLQSIYEDDENLHILAINMGEDPAVVAQWVQGMGLTYTILLDTERRLERLYALRGQPSTYVIAPDGVIAAIFYGPVSETALRSAIAPLVKEKSRP